MVGAGGCRGKKMQASPICGDPRMTLQVRRQLAAEMVQKGTSALYDACRNLLPPFVPPKLPGRLRVQVASALGTG